MSRMTRALGIAGIALISLLAWVQVASATVDGLIISGQGHIVGSARTDILSGGQVVSDDWLYGREGSDLLVGGPGNDFLFGGLAGDNLYGDDGNDVIVGGPGPERFIAGSGNDLIFTNGCPVHTYCDSAATASSIHNHSLSCGDGIDVVYVAAADLWVNATSTPDCEYVLPELAYALRGRRFFG